ncbi:retrotransposon protein, putative, ty1-copia subclass [Tanacetum coccineum]
MRETCVDLQSQGNYTLFRETMALPVQNINHSAFRSIFEKEKLSSNNFNDWFARLKLVLRVEKKLYVIEQPLPPALEPVAEPDIVAQWTALYDAHTEIACLMLGSMTPELHRQFEFHYPYDMIQEIRSMFEKQAGVEKFDLIQSFHDCKQEEGKPVADYVLKMKGYVEKLERLGYVLPQDITVGLILNGLTKDFVGFVRNYNMHNMGKTVGEIHAMLIEYEKGLPKKAETPQVMMIKGGKTHKANKKSLNAKGNNKVKGKGNGNKVYIPKPKNTKPTVIERPAKDDVCHHCKEVGHWKRNCPVYLVELLKKKKQVGSASSSGIFTIELFSFPNNNSWVYDTGCGTNICITKQGFRIERKLKQGALYLYVGNGVRAQVEAIGSFDLVLPNGLVICLDNCHYAPTITRGVVSVSRLVDNGFVQCFTDYGISVSKNDVLYFNVVSRNGIYEIDMHDLVPNVNSIYNVSNKRVKHNLDSTYLWHCRLAHINKKRIKQLQQDGLLKSTDDESFDKCESCLSGKMTKKPFPHSNERAKDLLGIIHTDVCGPLRHVSRQGASYFITFTDDYSRYGYVYLLKHKHEVFETFKVFKNEVENQLGKTIKAIRSDRGGEYISQEFKDYLKANGIVQQLTPPYTPQHNGVSERRNRTLLDMVRSMMNLTTLPLSFWDYALESATRILNMVPTKKGCEALVKRDTPDKLEQRSVKCIFIGYPKETMGYYFYFPPENKIVVARVDLEELQAKFHLKCWITEFECIAASEAAWKLFWIRKFILGLGARGFGFVQFIEENRKKPTDMRTRERSTNYTVWAIQIKVILEAHGLWEAIESKDNTEVDIKKDKATIAFLYQALTEDVILQVAGCETAKELWDSLKTRHYVGEEKVQQARLQSLMIGFNTLQMKDDDTVDAFTAKLNGYATKARELGKTLDESLLVRKLLDSTPDRFIQIVASIEQTSDLDDIL